MSQVSVSSTGVRGTGVRGGAGGGFTGVLTGVGGRVARVFTGVRAAGGFTSTSSPESSVSAGWVWAGWAGLLYFLMGVPSLNLTERFFGVVDRVITDFVGVVETLLFFALVLMVLFFLLFFFTVL